MRWMEAACSGWRRAALCRAGSESRREQVLPLVDGLDEVAAEHKSACVEAINAFHRQYGQLPLVVCSRTNEYESLQANSSCAVPSLFSL